MRVGIIGGGPAGYTAALKLARQGAEAIVFDKSRVGGVCLNRGCVPTKHLLAMAKTYAKAKKLGLKVEPPAVEDAVRYAVEGSEFFSVNIEKLLKKAGVQIINAEAVLEKGRKIVWDSGSEAFDAVIIASGSSPVIPEVFSGVDVLTGQDFHKFKSADRVVVVGAGAQGLEIASFFSLLGFEVIVVEALPRILPMLPEKYAKLYEARLKKSGLKIKTGVTVQSAEEIAGLKNLYLSDGSAIESIDLVIIAAGRKPNTEFIRVPGILDERGYVIVNDNLMTEEKGVYAAGDVLRTPALAYTAYAEGEAAAENILGGSEKVDYSHLPYAIFASPEIAWAGKLEGEEIRVQAGVSARAFAELEKEGFAVIFKENEKLNGGLIVGIEAPELIHFLELCLETGEIPDLFYVHPSLFEVVGEAFLIARGKARHV